MIEAHALISPLCRTCTRIPFSIDAQEMLKTITFPFSERAPTLILLIALGSHRFIPLKEDNSSTFITSRQVITSVIELHSGDDVGYKTSQC